MATAMRHWLAGLGAVLLLAGCPTREFYLNQAEVPWVAEGIRRITVPAFTAPPNAWVVADAARRALIEALDQGTVQVVPADGQAELKGAVVQFREQSTPGAPRRVQRTGSNAALNPNTFAWEMDVTHAVELRLAMRLVLPDGRSLWSKETFGNANETQTMTLNWPGSDPVPPPAIMPYPADPTLFDHLRERALKQALEPLMEALAVQYRYRPLP